MAMNSNQLTGAGAVLAVLLSSGAGVEVYQAIKDFGKLQEQVEQVEEANKAQWELIGNLKERVARLEGRP